MVDEVTDISVAEQMVTFIQYYSKADGKVKTQFLSVNDLLEDSESADAKTITKTIFNNLEKLEPDKKGLCAFVSDGAAVMTGVKLGVATLLKKENPQVISVHCICHRLALACTDTLQNVGYIKSVHTWLMQLWNMLQISPKKMASFLQIHLRIKNLQLTTQESKSGVSKRLKTACTTRWLSFDSSVQAIDSEYEAVLQTLNALKEKDPTSLGLFQKLKCVKFIGIIYMLVEVLPLLTVVGKTFQIGTIDFSKIGPTLEYTTEKLIAVKENKSPIKRLKDDLKEGQRLSELGITATEHKIQLIENHMNSYIDELIKNIDRRFRLSTSFECCQCF